MANFENDLSDIEDQQEVQAVEEAIDEPDILLDAGIESKYLKNNNIAHIPSFICHAKPKICHTKPG